MLINLLRLLPPEIAHEITIKFLKSNFAFKSHKIKEGHLLLMEAFGGGFTWGSALVRL